MEIPKPKGVTRKLGIPTVIDQMIQQAIVQVINPHFEEVFSDNSYGFRAGRSTHDALKKAKSYIAERRRQVVDIDLEKFFDNVNHDMLMHRVARVIQDKRVLKLIRAYLKAGVMQNGVISRDEWGIPQGSPLSPLLSNLMLDDLDKELERRSLTFVRYADDCNIYAKTPRAAERVMESITQCIESKLKLKVNREKSSIGDFYRGLFLKDISRIWLLRDRWKNHFKVPIDRVKRLKDKIRKLTSRKWAVAMEYRLHKLSQLMRGWVQYYKMANMKGITIMIDKWVRRRLRAVRWKEWKKIRAKRDNYIRLGTDKSKAWEYANTRKKYWRISGSWILTKTLTNQYWLSQGYNDFISQGYNDFSSYYLNVKIDAS